MSEQVSSAAYRRLVGLTDPDAQTEMSSTEYRQMVGGAVSVADHVGRTHSSQANTESPAKVSFREWLTYTTDQEVIEEFRGIPGRQFRFDWAIPALMIAVEYDGFIDHGTVKGMIKDSEKSNLSQLNGWLFIRVNAKSIRDGSAMEHVERAIGMRMCEETK